MERSNHRSRLPNDPRQSCLMGNVPAAVAGLVAILLVVGMFVLIVRVAAARAMAARRGQDPGEAAAVTLLGGRAGLAATYLKADGDDPHDEQPAPTSRAERGTREPAPAPPHHRRRSRHPTSRDHRRTVEAHHLVSGCCPRTLANRGGIGTRERDCSARASCSTSAPTTSTVRPGCRSGPAAPKAAG